MVSRDSESSHIEYKSLVRVDSTEEWCEILKDLVGIANAGGGVIYFGVTDSGDPVPDPGTFRRHDPVDFTNKLGAYTQSTQPDFVIRSGDVGDAWLWQLLIKPASVPIVFEREGSYDSGSGRPKIAFRVGVVYTRQAGKTCPANSSGLRDILDRQIQNKMKLIQKVIEAPYGSNVLIQSTDARQNGDTVSVRITDEENAEPVFLDDASVRINFPYSFDSLTKKLRAKVPGFKQNQQYHRVRKKLIDNQKSDEICYIRYLDPSSPHGSSKMLFTEKALDEMVREMSQVFSPVAPAVSS